MFYVSLVLDFNYDLKDKIISRKEKNTFVKTNGCGYECYYAMKQFNDNIVQIDADSGKKDTYGELLTTCIRTAIQMKSLGLKQSDIISLCTYNHLNSSVPFIAAQMIGVIVANTDPTLSKDDMQHLLKLAEPKMIFVSDNAEQLVKSSLENIKSSCKIVTFGKSDEFIEFKEFLKPQRGEKDFLPYVGKDGNDTAVILFSSGTTGMPKAICLSHNYMFFNTANLKRFSGLKVFLSYASLYWISTVFLLLFTITSGCTRVICKSYSEKFLWEYLNRYKVEFLFLAPTQAIKALNVMPENISIDLRYYTISGSQLSPLYLQRIRESLPKTDVILCYGQTESGLITLFYGDDPLYKTKPESCGQPTPGFQYKIVNPDTEEVLGYNQPGELRMKGPYLMNGYHKQSTSDHYDKDGFLKTGDIFYYDTDFCLYITDRLKEMFKYCSWHIVPAKLEAILESHPDVQMAAVIGIPHPEDDNHAMAVVVLNENAKASLEEIKNFVEKQVDDRHKLRAGVRRLKEMPLTPTGKIKRNELRSIMIVK